MSFTPRLDTHYGMKGWIAKEDFYIHTVTNDSDFTLFIRDADHFKKSASYDAFRFTINSLQSISEIRPNPSYSKISSWCLIKAYYASFFAAHSYLRIFGTPFTRLESGHVSIINKHIKSTLQSPIRVKSGNYLLSYDNNYQYLRFTHKSDAHKDLWNAYLVLCEKLSRDVLSLKAKQSDKAELQSYFDDLVKLLTKNGSTQHGNWLSQFRNEVNYQSPDGLWFPFMKNKIGFDDHLRNLKTWRRTPLNPSIALSNKTDMEWSLNLSILIIQTTFLTIQDYKNSLDNNNGIPSILENFINQTSPHSLL